VEDTEGAAAQPAQSETITETRGRVHKDWEGSAAVLCCAGSEKAYRQHALSSQQRCREDCFGLTVRSFNLGAARLVRCAQVLQPDIVH
jgi:hypothetical protein